MVANPLPDWMPLEWDIIGNPANWIIITLMVLLGTILVTMLIGVAKVTRENP